MYRVATDDLTSVALFVCLFAIQVVQTLVVAASSLFAIQLVQILVVARST